MLNNIIRDAQLAAQKVTSEIKDVVREMQTPDVAVVQQGYEETDMQNLGQAAPQMEYMNSGWNMNASVVTANQIDMIVDKMNFIANMVQNYLMGFDAIETELRALANQSMPPQPAQLIAIAGRIDMQQRQTYEGLQQLRALAKQVDAATDKLQNNTQSGWTQPVSAWNK